MTGVVIKIAFLYLSTNRSMIGNHAVVPTYRISMQVHPDLKLPHVSIALSEIGKSGEVNPVFLLKATDEAQLMLKAQQTKPK